MEVGRLARALGTRLVGRTIVHFSKVASTNPVARDMAQLGAPSGTVVVADFQSAGYGRRGRAWVAAPAECLIVSVVLRPRVAPAQAFCLTMVPALAVLDSARALGVADAMLKWPNDVQVKGKKLAGILTELSLLGQGLDHVVIGIGLNVDLDLAKHGEIAGQATSLALELGRPVEREEVALHLFRSLDRRYLLLEEGGADEIFEAWRDNLNTTGKWIEVSDAGGSFLAFAERVTPDGGLVLRRDGERQVVYAADVTLAKHQ